MRDKIILFIIDVKEIALHVIYAICLDRRIEGLDNVWKFAWHKLEERPV